MSLHIIHFMRPIMPDTLVGLQNVALQALAQGASEVRIHISSEGGANDQGFAAYHFIRSLPVPVTMHCIGNVESMALIMYLAADNRAIVPHGKIKIHPMLWGFPPGASIDHDRLTEFVSSLDFDATRYANIFKERTSGATEVIEVQSHLGGRAKLLDAPGAVACGVATAIAEASIPPNAIRWWV